MQLLKSKCCFRLACNENWLTEQKENACGDPKTCGPVLKSNKYLCLRDNEAHFFDRGERFGGMERT